MTEKKFSVTKNGKPLSPDLYTWDKKTKTFSTLEHNLVLDFSEYSGCTFDTGFGCTFDTGSGCTFDTGSDCTFKTGSGCTFDTGFGCTFDTGSGCTFKTGPDCTFKTGFGCTFDTGSGCLIIRRDIFEYFSPEKEKKYTLAPYAISGYILNGYYYEDGKKQYKAIIADNILSEILSEKKNKNLIVYKVRIHNKKEESYLIKDGDIYSHGQTIKDAKESLIYKISSRDTSAYKDLKLTDTVTKEEAIKMYRAITGACEFGTKNFVEGLAKTKKNYKISEIIELTKGQYGNEQFRNFFK